MPSTIARACTYPGESNRRPLSLSISSHPTARNSTPSSEFGNSLVVSVSTIATLDSSKRSSKPWKAGSSIGKSQTIHFGDYAQLFKTLCSVDFANMHLPKPLAKSRQQQIRLAHRAVELAGVPDIEQNDASGS